MLFLHLVPPLAISAQPIYSRLCFGLFLKGGTQLYRNFFLKSPFSNMVFKLANYVTKHHSQKQALVWPWPEKEVGDEIHYSSQDPLLLSSPKQCCIKQKGPSKEY